MAHDIAILGIFAADTAYRADRMPKIGETLLGRGFALNAGGKGSNQAVAAALWAAISVVVVAFRSRWMSATATSTTRPTRETQMFG